ncbi:MAG TPA: hypothetical protein ENN44_08040 [Methanoculleus sp.]|nr:hypothetical protein [Methanoculleus sp.]
MNTAELILIAVALAMDAFAVSISAGTTICEERLRKALVIAAAFGGFQAGMTVIGWLAGEGIRELVLSFAPLLAFALLLGIGAKMIFEGLRGDEGCILIRSAAGLLLLAVATSIDALAVGLSFAVIGIPVMFPAAVIGVVAFLFSIAGIFLGKRVADLIGRKAEIVGGIILILIGLRILLFS